MIDQKVKKIIAAQISVNVETIKDTNILKKDLGINKLDEIEIIWEIEEEFDISIDYDPESLISSLADKTVKQLIDYVTEIVGKGKVYTGN